MRIALFLSFLFCHAVVAQKLDNIVAKENDNQVVITYDLIGEAEHQYNISVFVARGSSQDFSEQINMIEGDITLVENGKNKEIIWKAKDELISYSGDVQFKLIATKVNGRNIKQECASVKLNNVFQEGEKLTLDVTITSNKDGWIMLKESEIVMQTIGYEYKNPEVQLEKFTSNKLIPIKANESLSSKVVFDKVLKQITKISHFGMYVQSNGYCTARFNKNEENAYFNFSDIDITR